MPLTDIVSPLGDPSSVLVLSRGDTGTVSDITALDATSILARGNGGTVLDIVNGVTVIFPVMLTEPLVTMTEIKSWNTVLRLDIKSANGILFSGLKSRNGLDF